MYQGFRKKLVPFDKPVVYTPVSRVMTDKQDCIDWTAWERDQWLSECGRKNRRHHYEWVVLPVGDEIIVK